MKKIGLVFVLVLFFSVSFQVNAQWYAITTPYAHNFNAVHFVDKNTGWICADSGLILHTTNRGIDWIEQGSGTRESLKDVKFISSQIGWVVGSNGVILNTTNAGSTWDLQASGIAAQLNSISVIDSDYVKVVGTEGKLLQTSNGGIEWNAVAYAPDNVSLTSIFFLNNNLGWICGFSYNPTFGPFWGVHKTTNAGNSWQLQNSGSGLVNDLFFVNENYGWVAGFRSCIMVSTNGGDNWVYKDFSNGTHYSYRLFMLNNSIGWITNYWDGNDLRFTSDGGDTWFIQAQTATRFNDITFTDQKYGWAVGVNGLLLTTDNGGGVFPTKPNLISPENNQQLVSDTVNLVWSSATPEITGYELFLSTDSLFSNTIDTLITDTTIILANLEINTKYYWKVKAKNEIGSGDESETYSFKTTLTGIDGTQEVPLSFSLSQNYPNPFNPSTNIQYAISSRQFVTLKVYDVLGKEIATLVNEEKSAGNYNVEFYPESSIKNPASGVYFYQLKAGDFVETKKMILLK